VQRRHRFAAATAREVGDPNKEGDGGYREADKRDDLDRTRIGERKIGFSIMRPPGQPK